MLCTTTAIVVGKSTSEVPREPLSAASRSLGCANLDRFFPFRPSMTARRRRDRRFVGEYRKKVRTGSNLQGTNRGARSPTYILTPIRA
jgi:hypothetical protein